MATLNSGEKPMKPSHLNRFFDRIRGKKDEKNAQSENEGNKENALVMSNNRISKDDSAQHWKIAEPQSAKEKPRSPLQRLRQRLSLRRKTADRNDSSHISSNEKIDDSGYKPANGNSFIAPRSAVSENDVRFLCLSQDPITSSTITQNGHYRHHSKGGAQPGVQSMSVDDVRDREASPFPAQPTRTPSYLKVSLGAHGYSTRAKVPLGELGCTLSNVERLRLVHQQQITSNMITTFGVDKPQTRTPTFEKNPDMGNLTTRPVKALVAKIEDLSVCKGKSADKSDDDEENDAKVHRPQLVIIQPLNEKEKPQKVIEMAEVNEIQGEVAEGRLFDQPILAVAEVTEGASQIATQQAGVHEDFATKVLSSAEQIVEADTAKAVATIIQVLPKENLRESMESVNSGEQYAKKLEGKKHEYQALIASAAKDCKILESDSNREEAHQILQESIASTQLFMNGKMKQYEGLIEKNLNPIVGDACPVLVSDLAGWWDMLMIQFEKLDLKFTLVEQMRRNNWEKPAEKVATIEKKNNNNNVKIVKNKEPVTKEVQMKRDEANEKRKKMLAEARERAKANAETESQIFVSSTDN